MINRKDLLEVLALSEGWGRHSLDSALDLQQTFPGFYIVLHLERSIRKWVLWIFIL